MKPPLPEPVDFGYREYGETWISQYGFTHDQLNAYADACVEAETAVLRKEVERLKTVPMKYRRMEFNAQLQAENKVLRDALAKITEIPNEGWGSDWYEIEKARDIARVTLNKEKS